MNNLLNGLKTNTNFAVTENGALTHKSTMSAVLDMFAMGGAYRTRSDEDVILMFRKALREDETYALKCLFYLRDCRGGQGERRFWRVCMKDLAKQNPEAARRNLQHIPIYGRWDDLYVFVGTPLEDAAFDFIKEQLALDVQSKTPSLLAKWLKSINTSSRESRELGHITRKYLGMTNRQYRKTLSILRGRIKVLERLMSAGKWDEIEFDKIPSRAGLIYKNAFARHDVERMKEDKNIQSYADFVRDETKSVNAKTLYPYECVAEALKIFRTGSYWSVRDLPPLDDTNRLAVNKYWANLEDYFGKASLNALCMIDTSGSMVSSDAAAPINVAISLGLYCAERANGPFANHYISFASRPQLIETEGVDFVDKVYRIYKTNLVDSTNIEAAFDLLLNTAIQNGCSQDDIPANILVISDMEFDAARGYYYGRGSDSRTLMENIALKWQAHGYRMPHLVYWNVQARQNNIPQDIGCGYISFVSGMSPSIFETILSGKTGYELMLEKLNSSRYDLIR